MHQGRYTPSGESETLHGFHVDNFLTWKAHIQNIHNTIAVNLALLRRINQYFRYKARKTFYNSYILPLMDYCSTLWGNATTSDRIYQLQRRPARIIRDSEYRAPSVPPLEQLNWLPLVERIKYRQSQLVYKAVNGLAPEYMCALFTPISNISTRTTRSNERGDLYVPKARTNIFKNSIAVNGAHVWNELDPIIRNSNSFSLLLRRRICIMFLTRKQ